MNKVIFFGLIWLAVGCAQNGGKDAATEPTAAMDTMLGSLSEKEDLFTILESVYGRASSEGFGTAAFSDTADGRSSIGDFALRHYHQFLGKKYDESSSTYWDNGFIQAYQRPPGTSGDILKELGGIKDPSQSIALLTSLKEPQVEVKKALEKAFNDLSVEQLVVYFIGDGEAYSGAIITALYAGGKLYSVAALMD